MKKSQVDFVKFCNNKMDETMASVDKFFVNIAFHIVVKIVYISN